MATIKKRGQYYHVRVRVRVRGYPTICRSFNTHADATAWARRTETEIDRGEWRDRTEAERTTVRKALDKYVQEVSPTKKGKGCANETSKAEVIKRYPISKLSLARVRGADVASYRNKRLKERCRRNTVRLELVLLSHLFTIARTEWSMPLTNPVAEIRRPSVKLDKRKRRLRPGEEDYLLLRLRASRAKYLEEIVKLALETAMRRSELLMLRWEHIDIQQRTAHLPDTKNGEPRTVPLSTSAVAILKSLPRQLDGSVFGARDPTNVSQTFHAAVLAARSDYERNCDKHGIKPDTKFLTDLHFHDLRHEGTSRLFERGLDVTEVAAITGHKTLQQLKDYTHLPAQNLAKKLA
ncbi:MAG: site-specific integrase [Gammaproteobacteria bacterium]|nr:site-specific integrase [Gammaproteobacteria bacterium]